MAFIWARNSGKHLIWQISYRYRRPSGHIALTNKSLKTSSRRVAEEKLKEYQVREQQLLHDEKPKLLADKIDDVKASLDAMRTADTSSTPLKEFWNRYERHLLTKSPYRPEQARRRKSYKSEISRIKAFRSFLERRHPDVNQLEQITAAIINAFLEFKRINDKVAPKTANHYRVAIGTMLNVARERYGYICSTKGLRNPVDSIKPYKGMIKPIFFLTLPQIKQQLQALSCENITELYREKKIDRKYRFGPRLQIAVAICIYAGLRREELLWLTPDDVQLGNLQSILAGQPDCGTIIIRSKNIDGRFWQPKTGSGRSIPISLRLFAYLSKYQPPASSRWYLPGPNGHSRWDCDNWSRALREINIASDLVEMVSDSDAGGRKQHARAWSALDYRHTFGSHLAQKGESLYKISTLMGNSPEICRRHYAALVPQSLRSAVEFDQEPETTESAANGIVRLSDYLAS